MQDDGERERISFELQGNTVTSDPFAAAVRTTRMPMIVTDPSRHDNPIIFCNDAFVRLTGYSREETLGQNCRFLQGAGTNMDDVGKVRDAVEERRSIEIDLLNYKKNGDTFWNRLLVSPVFDGDELTYFFASQFDVTPERERLNRLEVDQATLEAEIRRRVVDLTQSEERLNFTLRAARLGSWTLDIASGRLVVSNIFKENFGRAATGSFDLDDMREATYEPDRGRWQEAVDQAIKGRQDFDVEFRIRAPDGEIRWLEMRGQPTFTPSGNAQTLAGVSLDVTERKRAEEHRQLLVRELNHRVKNTLATVQSIVRQSLRSTRSVAEAGEAADSRIRALSMAHDVLTDESWSGAAMSDLVSQTLRPFVDESGGRLRAKGDPVRLKPRAALAISMALHELATNAVKYGALSNERGTVNFDWHIDDGANGEVLAIRWREEDGPPVAQPTQVGFGSRLIERALASEIGGTAKIDYRPEGVVFTIDAPLESVSAPVEPAPV